MSVIINETIKEYISYRSIVNSYILRLFLSENSLRIIFVPLLKQQHSSGWRSRPVAFPLQYLTGKTFFCMSFVSDRITSVKHMVKQDEVIFFLSDKKFESTYFINNYNTMIMLSTWIKEEGRKVLYYQKTQVIIWNLLRITTANAYNVVRHFSFFCRTE